MTDRHSCCVLSPRKTCVEAVPPGDRLLGSGGLLGAAEAGRLRRPARSRIRARLTPGHRRRRSRPPSRWTWFRCTRRRSVAADASPSSPKRVRAWFPRAASGRGPDAYEVFSRRFFPDPRRGLQPPGGRRAPRTARARPPTRDRPCSRRPPFRPSERRCPGEPGSVTAFWRSAAGGRSSSGAKLGRTRRGHPRPRPAGPSRRSPGEPPDLHLGRRLETVSLHGWEPFTEVPGVLRAVVESIPATS